MKVRFALGRRNGFTDEDVPRLGMLDKPKVECSWQQFAKNMSKHKVCDDKAGVQYFVGGYFNNKRRIDENLAARTFVTLDFDKLEPWDVEAIKEIYADTTHVAYSTFSHSDDAPKLRVAIPLDREIYDPVEYQAIARQLAARFNIDAADPVSWNKMNQFMWVPSHPEGADSPISWSVNAQTACCDDILATYDDWQDWGEWPAPSEEGRVQGLGTRAGNPFEKPGVIGAFNTVFNIPMAIQQFDLPYDHVGEDDRWMYTLGEGNPGVILYTEEDYDPAVPSFLWSNHSDDPVHGKMCSAFDLVRIHRFGDMDDGYTGEIGNAPSQQAMNALALENPEVSYQLNRDIADEEFEDVSDDTDDQPKKKQRLTYESIRDSIDKEGELTNDSRRKFIAEIAAARLDASETDVLASFIRAACEDPKPAKGSILEEIKKKGKQLTQKVSTDGQISDIEVELIQAVLDEHYGGGDHIRRFGRQFWCYEGGVWLRREDEYVRGHLQKTFITLRTERPKDALELAAAVGESKTSAITGALWAMFCSHVTSGIADPDPMGLLRLQVAPVINCLNGEVHFDRKGRWTFTGHHPELFLTSQVPVAFDPDADTSLWDTFASDILLESFIERDDMRRHLEEVGGYILQPSREIASFFMMRGAPRAGKSTFGALINELAGQTVANKQITRFGGTNKHDTAGLVGKLAVLDEDFKRGKALPDDFIKQASEARRMTADPKGKDEFDFVCRSVPIIFCNDWPYSSDHSGAIERRLVAWDLPTIPEPLRDEQARRELLRDGLAGALLRFAEGFARVHARGEWQLPDDCVEAGARWSEGNDIVQVWISQCLERKEKGGWVPRPSMYGWFSTWCRENLPGRTFPSKLEFLRRVERQMGAFVKRNGERGVRGYEYTGDEDAL